MPKEEWGLKRTCLSCGARFYDLRRDPVACPKCGAIFEVAELSRPRRARAEPKAAVKEPEEDLVEEAEVEEEDEAEEATEVPLETVEEDDEDDEDGPKTSDETRLAAADDDEEDEDEDAETAALGADVLLEDEDEEDELDIDVTKRADDDV